MKMHKLRQVVDDFRRLKPVSLNQKSRTPGK